MWQVTKYWTFLLDHCSCSTSGVDLHVLSRCNAFTNILNPYFNVVTCLLYSLILKCATWIHSVLAVVKGKFSQLIWIQLAWWKHLSQREILYLEYYSAIYRKTEIVTPNWRKSLTRMNSLLLEERKTRYISLMAKWWDFLLRLLMQAMKIIITNDLQNWASTQSSKKKD